MGRFIGVASCQTLFMLFTTEETSLDPREKTTDVESQDVSEAADQDAMLSDDEEELMDTEEDMEDEE